MPERIMQDPHLEAMLDHAGPHYDVIQDMFVQNRMTVGETVQVLNDSWTCSHNEQIQQWEQQTIDDEEARQ
jgi:hypothetical protein